MCNNIKCNTVSCSSDLCLVTWGLSPIVTPARYDWPTAASPFLKENPLLWPKTVINWDACTARMEKRYITGCFCSLLHIWALNYSCWKWTEIYSELDRISDWAWSPAPPPHTAMEPRTHMGAIICKVAVEAPGNNFESVCVCLCVYRGTCGEHTYIYSPLSHPPN